MATTGREQYARAADRAYDALVLAGGAARRLGGTDKLALDVGGRPLLDRVLDACAGATRRIVVGPERPTTRRVRWCREDPPGSGPVAGIAAGLTHTDAPVVLVVAGDLPFLTGEVVQSLVAATAGRDGAVLVDAAGAPQPLAGAYDRTALAAALDRVGPPDGVAVRRLVAGLDLAHVPDSAGASADCDTWPDVRRARARATAGEEPRDAR